MLLIDDQIRYHREFGAIAIDPFNLDQLNNASYDLTLGPYIARHSNEGVVRRVAEEEQRFTLEDHRDTGYFFLSPGERILGHTNEFVGGRIGVTPEGNPIAVNTHLQATSTAARIGLTACLCAGWGDVGYVNRWTLEINNLSPVTLQIPVGSIIAQIVFHQVVAPGKLYHEKGQYQAHEEIEKVKASWKPENMLPGKLKTRDFWKTLYGEDDDQRLYAVETANDHQGIGSAVGDGTGRNAKLD